MNVVSLDLEISDIAERRGTPRWLVMPNQGLTSVVWSLCRLPKMCQKYARSRRTKCLLFYTEFKNDWEVQKQQLLRLTRDTIQRII